MAKLIYKTRGNSSPQGKAKVYFCSHPDDFGKYFEELSNEILEKQNCAVWYLESYDTQYDEQLLEDLSEMQLFVMPITAALLRSPNHALEVEFKFALEKHIPVLPILMEYGLTEMFNEKCGEIQFLDRVTQDTTVDSYDKKLADYLVNVLIGDELAEKIRNAFDAYVFLSYRKKDRKYAKDLMSLIHKNEFFRDVAIWYDEFLIPGENFSTAIEQAIRESKIFVLNVTPNLVNEQNYIMDIEYPAAKKENIPILPVEMVPTERVQLAEKFEGIPECINASNDAKLMDALSECIKNVTKVENNTGAEHKFFIDLLTLAVLMSR